MAIGAVEKLFYQLAGEWVNNGNQVAFVCCGGGEDARMKFVRLKKYSRTGSTKKDLIWDFFYSVKALWKCPKTDILLCNTFWTPALAPLFRWKYKRLVYGVHRYPKGQFWLYPFVHAFICVSTVVARALQSELRSGTRVCTIVNPIDDTVFHGLSPRTPVHGRVLYAGRIHPAKGLVCLAEACSRLYGTGSCTELVIVGVYDKAKGGGGDEFVAELRNAAAPCPVIADGPITDASGLADIERTAQVFVYPSEDAFGEACPIAPMEAMAIGVPTIVSDMACYMDYVIRGENAEIFKPGDVSSLCDQLDALLRNSDESSRLAANAVSSMTAYSRSNVANKYERLMLGLIRGQNES